MKLVVEETFDHGQVSTQEQIIKGENFEYLEDYFTLEETEERVQENADVNTEADHEDANYVEVVIKALELVNGEIFLGVSRTTKDDI